MSGNPYIGITDFTRPEQARAMLDVLKKHRQEGSRRMLHVGVMTSYKVLNGQPTKWSVAFPPREDIPGIFCLPPWDEPVMNCLHFADYDNNPDLWRTITELVGVGGLGMTALQLDMIWPDPREIFHGLDLARDRVEVILQVGAKALDAVDNDPEKLVCRLEDYRRVIHRVLLDKSMGQGRHMDAQALLPFVRAINKHLPQFDITVAGGLGPETLHLVEPIVQEFPDVSIDAQGRLRSSGSALDPIDWDLAEQYLVRALGVLS